MKNTLLNEMSHLLMRQYVKSSDIVIDATMGNGQDTLYLAKLAQMVYAFDIQNEALIQTKKSLDESHIKNVKLILDSHENILNYVKDFDYVIFNLGYLPKGNKEITTRSLTTLKALDLVLEHLPIGGFVQMMVYLGHEEGIRESKDLDNYFSTLSLTSFKIMKIDLPYQDNFPPYILLVQKLNDHIIKRLTLN